MTQDKYGLSNNTRLLAAALGLTFILGVLVIPGGADDTHKFDAFAKCLTSKKASMYGSFWCLHCDDQKKLFGESFQYVTYLECSIPGSRELSPACKFAQIRHTPTWIFTDGVRVEGMQSLQKLSERTGCALP